MTIVTDTRGQGGSGGQSRENVKKRYKDILRDRVREKVANGDIKQIGKEGIDIVLPKKDMKQPHIHHGPGGKRNIVHPGNKDFVQGDRIERPKGGGGSGGKSGKGDASDTGHDDSDMVIHLNKDEFLNIWFEDLGLPNLNITSSSHATKTKVKYAGVVKDGDEEKTNFEHTRMAQLGRRAAMTGRTKREMLVLLQQQRSILLTYDQAAGGGKTAAAAQVSGAWESTREKIKKTQQRVNCLKRDFLQVANPEDRERLSSLDQQLKTLRKRIDSIPYLDTMDMRHNTNKRTPVPVAKAVMFCLMDVSGSMTEQRRYKAQSFFTLLYLFLERNYTQVDIRFVRHTTEAEEVDQDKFFNEQKSGGTKVSTGLEKVLEIKKAHYDASEWNLYLAQASDGENWGGDDPVCDKLMREILKDFQYVFYTEITEDAPQSLWETYDAIRKDHKDKFAMGRIKEQTDVMKVFREFLSQNARPEARAQLHAAFSAYDNMMMRFAAFEDSISRTQKEPALAI